MNTSAPAANPTDTETGQPQCTATTRGGKRCKRRPRKGATVCKMHGGNAPQVIAKAKVRAAQMEAHELAERMVARAGVDADPIEHLLESLHRAAALVEIWGSMVAKLDASTPEKTKKPGTLADGLLTWGGEGGNRIHPYVVEYQSAIERRAKMAKLCIDAGVAERQVRVAEQQAQVIAHTLIAVLNELGIKQTREVNGVVAKHLRLAAGPS